ncbi:MAG: aquaporin family protein [Cyclobacteriaceae bacterium]|nr:aquaporin family protein [Cyclobacteriaceae bacterium]
MSAYLAEFLGTALLILLGEGVCAGVTLKESKAQHAGWLVVVIAWGIAVTLAIYAVGSVSGAHLNPAVTIAMALNGSFEWQFVPGYVLSQVAGAMLGAALVWLQYFPHWKGTTDAGAKLGIFCTAPAVRHTFWNLVSETIATMVLILGLLFLGANDFSEGLKPLVVGLLIIAIGLSLGGTTGFAINPARDFGPRLAHFLLPIQGKGGSDWGYAWIPVVGPVVGGLLAVLIYQSLFIA